MAENSFFHTIADGDVVIWINEGGAITIKAQHRTDPVELVEDEALEIAAVLIDLVRKVQS